jgi:excisionase family DNA binding protein
MRMPGLGRTTVLALADAGELPRVRFGRAVRFSVSDIDAVVERRRSAGGHRQGELAAQVQRRARQGLPTPSPHLICRNCLAMLCQDLTCPAMPRFASPRLGCLAVPCHD